VSKALETLTEHVPAPVLVNDVDVASEQPAVPADVTTKLTTPTPEPPEVTKGNAVPNVPEIEVSNRSACVPFPMTMAVDEEETTLKLESNALVAVTEHVPGAVNWRSVEDALVSEHPVAPCEFTTKVSAPEPEPPLVVNVMGDP
jgi:hypothetical protein